MIIAKYLPELRSRPKAGVAIALGLLALCFALRYFTPLRLTYVTFYPAIMLATFVAGPRVGAAITVASALLAVYFFIPPAGAFALSATDMWGLGAFLFVSAIIVFVTNLLATAVTRLSEQSRQLLLAKDQTRVLMHELTHRMKNQYSVILAMARASEKSTSSTPEFLDRFTKRLHGLAHSHDLLVSTNWKGVSLETLVSIVLEPFSSDGKYVSNGPVLEMNDVAVVNLGMALHELATNSGKHGAWSRDTGRVSINWQVGKGQFILEWSEIGGPKVSKAIRKGFGRTVLEQIVPGAVEGVSELEFNPRGLRWVLTAPVDRIKYQAEAGGQSTSLGFGAAPGSALPATGA